MIQAMAHEYGLSAEYIADEAERTFNTIFTRKGERAPLEDVLAAMHAVMHAMMRNSVKANSKRH